jgi:hypothetical protein
MLPARSIWFNCDNLRGISQELRDNAASRAYIEQIANFWQLVQSL